MRTLVESEKGEESHQVGSVAGSFVFLKVIPVVIIGPTGEIDTFAYLDGCSTTTLLLQNTAQKVGVKGRWKREKLSWIDGGPATVVLHASLIRHQRQKRGFLVHPQGGKDASRSAVEDSVSDQEGFGEMEDGLTRSHLHGRSPNHPHWRRQRPLVCRSCLRPIKQTSPCQDSTWMGRAWQERRQGSPHYRLSQVLWICPVSPKAAEPLSLKRDLVRYVRGVNTWAVPKSAPRAINSSPPQQPGNFRSMIWSSISSPLRTLESASPVASFSPRRRNEPWKSSSTPPEG